MPTATTSDEAGRLGERVATARRTNSLSVAQLADLAGVSRAYLHQIESGDCKRPSAQVLYNLATVLGTSIAHLLGKPDCDKEPVSRSIPRSLLELAASRSDIAREDVEMLAAIRHRGKQPRTTKDWEFVWESIVRSVR